MVRTGADTQASSFSPSMRRLSCCLRCEEAAQRGRSKTHQETVCERDRLLMQKSPTSAGPDYNSTSTRVTQRRFQPASWSAG